MTELTNPRRSLARFDASAERVLGVDARLIYGFAGPVVGMSLLIVLMMLSRSAWAVAAAMIVEVLLMAVVIAGFVNVLEDDRDAS